VRRRWTRGSSPRVTGDRCINFIETRARARCDASMASCHEPSHNGHRARRMLDWNRKRGVGKMKFVPVIGTAMIALLAVSSEGMAQHKTTSDCQKEWQASKAANLVRGMTERAYLDQCRAGDTSAARAASFVSSSPARTAASVSSPPPAAVSARPANGVLCE